MNKKEAASLLSPYHHSLPPLDLQRLLRGGDLGLLLGGADAGGDQVLAEEGADRELLGVVRAVLAHDAVAGRGAGELLRGLLEAALRVEVQAQLEDARQAREHELVDERLGRPDVAVEVQRADHRLEGVGEDVHARLGVAVLGLAVREVEVGLDVDLLGDVGERLGVDESRAPVGELALRVRVVEVEVLGDDMFVFSIKL